MTALVEYAVAVDAYLGAADPVLAGQTAAAVRAARADAAAAASWNRSDHRPTAALRGKAAAVAMPSTEAFAPAWHRPR